MAKDVAKDMAHEMAKDMAKDVAKDMAHEMAKDMVKDIAKDMAHEMAKDMAKDVAKEAEDRGKTSVVLEMLRSKLPMETIAQVSKFSLERVQELGRLHGLL